MKTLNVQPLNAENFAAFGDVIDADPATAVEINAGFATRFHKLATADCDDHVILSIFRGRPRELSVGMVERHPRGSQAFMPLGGRNWIAVAATAPEPAACRAFLCSGAQGLQFTRGVWHHPLIVLGGDQDFLVVDRGGEGSNLEEVFFTTDIPITL